MKKMILLISMIFIISSTIFCDGPATVDLGTAGNYVILAKTGVSTTGTTAIVGNIGVSPAAATYITGFGLIMDPSGTFSTSSLVTGRVYAADYTEPTPSNLTTAISNVETAYTDAAGRLNPDFTELYAGNLPGGQTLVPGLYKWSSVVLISAGGVTISGNPDDVWIFQISQNLTVADGAIVTLSGGAQPQNIFWQIAGGTTIGTTAQFKGIILCQTLISLNTGATLSGRLLAQTAVTLDANSVNESDHPLPVTLSSFTAEFEDDSPVLYWTTQSETDNLGWNIYRSISENGIDEDNYNQTNADLISGMGISTEPTDYTFIDEYPVIEGLTYWYWLESVSTTNELELHGPISLEIPIQGIIPNSIAETTMNSNYPNPFNPRTTINFSIEEGEKGTLSIYNIKGQEVFNQRFETGEYNLEWNADGLSSGIYFYRLQTSSKNITKKMILMK
ncbi:MAG: ice-binding family protein [Candidatus Cloacimonadales bacterium]|nr:ice-binding family protein [Candidatus Cloacimonadales bacterium]